jgi:hypothetical protein
MTILLSQLFSPATLVADFFLAPRNGASGDVVVARPRGRMTVSRYAPSGTARDRLLNTVLWLWPVPEERPYAL